MAIVGSNIALVDVFAGTLDAIASVSSVTGTSEGTGCVSTCGIVVAVVLVGGALEHINAILAITLPSSQTSTVKGSIIVFAFCLRVAVMSISGALINVLTLGNNASLINLISLVSRSAFAVVAGRITTQQTQVGTVRVGWTQIMWIAVTETTGRNGLETI